MARYGNTILTSAGLDLAKRTVNGTSTFKITRVVTSGDSTLQNATIEQVMGLTSLNSIVQTGTVTAFDTSNPKQIGLKAQFVNRGLTNQYKIYAVGIYAQEAGKSEILYAVAPAVDPETMPARPSDSEANFTFTLQIYVAVANSSSVTISATTEGVVKSINSLTPNTNGNVVVDTSSHAKAIQEQLNSGKLYIPVLDDAGNPLTDESGNVLLNIQYLPKTISINGGQKVEADSSNNINLQTYTKQAIKNWMETKADKTDADLAHRALQARIDANLANEATARTNGDNSVLTQAKAYTDAAKTGLTAAMNNFYQKADIDSKLSAKLDASKAGTPSVITTAVDLNTITTCGSYFIQNSLGTTTNTPIPNAWLYVRVEGVPNRITQTLWKDIDPANQWVRVFTGSWGKWTQITKAI